MSRETAGVVSDAGFVSAEFGERIGADTLRFVRNFAAPIERVWNAVTTPQGVAAWLGAPIAIELAVGGTFAISFSDEDRMDGRVLELEPNRRLAIAWHETSNDASSPPQATPDDESVVTFDLSPGASGGTILVFTHRYIHSRETMIGLGAGWHAHLHALRARLEGLGYIDRDALYATLEPLYAARLESTQ